MSLNQGKGRSTYKDGKIQKKYCINVTRSYFDPSNQFKTSKIPELGVGMQGILITTNDKEKLCVSEAYDLLNEVRMNYYSY